MTGRGPGRFPLPSTATLRRAALPLPLGGALLLASTPGVASTVVGTSVSANTTVISACTVSGTTLNFGNTLNPIAGGATTGSSTLTVQCTATTGYTVSLSAGINTGNGSNFAARVLKNGADSIAYQLYTSNTYTTVWGDGTNGSGTVGGTGSGGIDTLTIYGRLPSLTGAVPGTYTDTVTVTITY